MLANLCFLDKTSQKDVKKVAVVTLLIVITTGIILLVVGIYLTTKQLDTALHASRIVFIEASVPLVFLPFNIILLIGINKDKLSLIRVWINATIIQTIYLFLLNVGILAYIAVNLDLINGLAVLIYSFVGETVLMEIILFVSGYHRHQHQERETMEMSNESTV